MPVLNAKAGDKVGLMLVLLVAVVIIVMMTMMIIMMTVLMMMMMMTTMMILVVVMAVMWRFYVVQDCKNTVCLNSSSSPVCHANTSSASPKPHAKPDRA